MYTATDDIQYALEVHQTILYIVSALSVIIPIAILWTCKRCANTKLQVCCSPFTEEDLRKLDTFVEERPERRRNRAEMKAAKALQHRKDTETTIDKQERYEMKLHHKNPGGRHKKLNTTEDPKTRELTTLMKTKTEKQTSTEAECHLCHELLPPGLLQTHYTNEHKVTGKTTSFNTTST